MPHATSGPKKGQRVATNERTKALRGFKPKSKKTATGSAAVGGAGSS